MKKKIKYTDESLGDIKLVSDHFPKPHELVFKEDTVKVTIELTKNSVAFFKEQAKKHHTHYQAMIRTLLNYYSTICGNER
ncbi:MAG: hypothetical protein ACD_62C00543G0007 [uncultured bacterium]|nr:MAG: hypothetical protein ACD_62C00543G0007 [uncultured bacterium]HLD44596.1 CopG family transcriptional regulator [bacterium]